MELIRQILFNSDGSRTGKRILVCGASNLSVDNILERLLNLTASTHGQIKCTRVGHPARVKALDTNIKATLDTQVANSDQVRYIYYHSIDAVIT